METDAETHSQALGGTLLKKGREDCRRQEGLRKRKKGAARGREMAGIDEYSSFLWSSGGD